MATADWVQTNGFGLVLWMTRRCNTTASLMSICRGRLLLLGFFLSNIAKRSRPRELHPFIQYAASTTSTRASSLRERSAATNRRTSSVEKSLDLALFFIGNRPEALAQRDRGVRILETFFRRMVPRSLDRLTHHNLDALRTPAAQVWVCVDERFLVPLHYLLEHLGPCPAITVDGGVEVIHAG
jgi:hypothetical protein